MSELMKMRLQTATVVARNEHAVTVQLERNSDFDWIHTGNKRTKAILDAFRELFAPQAEILFVVKKKATQAEESASVELPLEGRRLEEYVKHIFLETEGASNPTQDEQHEP